VTGLDTNVLVRYLVRDDPAQAARADRELERDERFFVNAVVLCELVWVLETVYGFGRDEVGLALDRILATAQFEIEDKDLALAALQDLRRTATDFADCLIGRRNRNRGATDTATFDKTLKDVDGFRLL
jgi:predicted nucleic-acid-binding protein